MNACLDIGNTRMKVGIFSEDEMLHHFIFDEDDFTGLAQVIASFAPQRAIISSTKRKQDSIAEIFQSVETIYLDSNTPLPIESNYTTPKTLGKDRLAAAVGAIFLDKHKGAAIIDAGTCMTLDFIDKNSIYQGGNISPGMRMRIEAMHAYTDKLPLVPTKLPISLLGKSTETALQNGALRGVLFEIEGFVAELKKQEKEINIILTGGDADFLAEYLKTTIFVSPNLVLIGLNQILSYNV